MQASGQQLHMFYDYQWKPCDPGQARFVSEVIKTDSGWLRYDYFVSTHKLQMKGLYEDSSSKMANGFFYYYYANGMPEQFGKNVHNKKQGLWLSFYDNGAMQDSTVYEEGRPAGTSIGWHFNGYQQDSIVYNDDGTAVEVDWSTNGIPSAAGRWKYGKMDGPWQFFHNNGKLAAQEVYDTGKLVSAAYFDREGSVQDSAAAGKSAEFQGGQKGWQNFLYRNIYFPDQYRITNAETVTVVIAALIDEDGNIQDPYIKVPFNKAFDDIALKVFKRSPRWLPAVRHNHAVISGIIQPITFSQEE